MKKKISVVIPTYNEEANVVPLSNAIIEVMERDLPEYDYEILFIDNHSKDNTQALLRVLCQENKKIKAIFNARNFGQARSPVYGMKQAYGDCVIRMCADFQDPVEMIVQFVREWEKGHKIVIGVKKASREKRVMYWIRTCYYKMIRKITDIDHIEHYTGFGLYDKKFVDVVRKLHDPMPYLRGIVAELGFDYVAIPYTQQKRRAGKSKNNFYSLYDYAMIGITSYSKVVMRLATFLGFLVGGCSFAAGIVYLILKLLYWDRFSAGVAPMLIGMFLLGALQLFFIGFLGEYVLSINTRVLDRPLVVEEERLNFQEETASEETAPDVQKQVEQLQTQLAQLQETLAKAQQMSGEGSEAAAAVKAVVEETAAKAAAAMAEGAVAHG
ncbi:MAG TPA: glycosyltransferase family 2 protein [Candidatus Blautia gallistercoris]|uniref:Glycosyltransferase family 2 protein n=1 Tax=Candidatus Blautia gallistercoris TaxID=2838490 RepID=A0A9D1WI40_9FIRM|nr:glycosyltransferase family 2 protein [Candidatus Blautia gallistercoris]